MLFCYKHIGFFKSGVLEYLCVGSTLKYFCDRVFNIHIHKYVRRQKIKTILKNCVILNIFEILIFFNDEFDL